MKVALITTDNREPWKKYELPAPIFGPAPEALLQGFAELGKVVEVHVICCVRKPVAAPAKVADNIWYHSVPIPSWGMMKSLYVPVALAARRKLAAIRPDIVHGQGTERECSLAAVFSGYPNVLTIHGNMRQMIKWTDARVSVFHLMTAGLERLVLPRTAGVFCNSVYTRSLIAGAAAKTWLVPNAINLAFFSPIPSRQARPRRRDR